MTSKSVFEWDMDVLGCVMKDLATLVLPVC